MSSPAPSIPNASGSGRESGLTPLERRLIAFFGTNYDDPHDLCGEIELWLEDEQYVMTKSFLAYAPAGMKHCPLKIRRVDRPIFHFAAGLSTKYE